MITFCRFCARRFVQIYFTQRLCSLMFNAGRGHALGRGRGRGLGFAPPPPPCALGVPPMHSPPFAVQAGALLQWNHDGERANGPKVPAFRDLKDDATLAEREHCVGLYRGALIACSADLFRMP